MKKKVVSLQKTPENDRTAVSYDARVFPLVSDVRWERPRLQVDRFLPTSIMLQKDTWLFHLFTALD
jgi:hypothetical protein